ncbi:fluoride efflux transporter CrcB [Halosolutus halophilus]|uniref:fluoride efflux transporter CrcB n=1 Tax=Halosolutus halophilus TaxID=1552990 RepID=UPI0022350ADB|nr:fluoride efflux transporter CrcB [Halosolutus halophilus]
MIDPLFLVGFGGAIGALGRYTVSSTIERERFPLSTFMVNVIGSFLLGLVMFADVGESVQLFVGVGVCGAFTTFSTFSVDTIRLLEDGYVWTAVVYALGNILVSVTAIGIAWVLLV